MRTIVVLEDEVAAMEVLRHTLEEQYTLIEAASAEEALSLFIGQDDRVDLLLAEVMLRTSFGIQVALLLRGNLAELPAILTSGYPVDGWSENDAADLERLGSTALAIAQEPFLPHILSNVIRQLIGSTQSEPKTRERCTLCLGHK